MIIDIFRNYFKKYFTGAVAEKLAGDYTDAFYDFIDNNLKVDGKEDYPYYNINGKKYNAMFFINNKDWIKTHIKGNENKNENSAIAALLNKFAKKADNIVIEFYIDTEKSKLIKDNKGCIQTNTLYIAEDLSKLISDDKYKFIKKLYNILIDKRIINIDEPYPTITIGDDTPIEIYIEATKKSGKKNHTKEDKGENEVVPIWVSNHGFDKEGIHYFTKTKYNLLGYDKDGYDKNGINIMGVKKGSN